MNTAQKIEALKNQVTSLPYTARAVFTNVAALQNVWLDRKAVLILELSHHPKPNPLDIPNSTNHSYSLILTPMFAEIATLRLTLDLAEASQEYIAAAAVIQPMLDLLAALEAVQVAEIAEKSARLGALREAEVAALAAATAKAAADPAVVAARKALDALDAPSKRKPAHEGIGEVS